MAGCCVSCEAKTITLVGRPLLPRFEDAASKRLKLPLESGPTAAPTTNSSELRCNSPDETSDELIPAAGSSGFPALAKLSPIRNAAKVRRRPSAVGIDCLHPIECSLELSKRFPPH